MVSLSQLEDGFYDIPSAWVLGVKGGFVGGAHKSRHCFVGIQCGLHPDKQAARLVENPPGTRQRFELLTTPR